MHPLKGPTWKDGHPECWQGCGGPETLEHASEDENRVSTLGGTLAFLKLNVHVNTWSSLSAARYLSEEVRRVSLQKLVNEHPQQLL